jgi:hypothetical protein
MAGGGEFTAVVDLPKARCRVHRLSEHVKRFELIEPLRPLPNIADRVEVAEIVHANSETILVFQALGSRPPATVSGGGPVRGERRNSQ